MTTELTTDVDTIQQTLGAAGLGFGVVGVLAPRALGRVYGFKEPDDRTAFMTRLWSSRNLLIGAMTLTAPSGEVRKNLFSAAAAMHGLDVAVELTAPGIPARTRFLGALTSLAFAGAAGYAASLES